MWISSLSKIKITVTYQKYNEEEKEWTTEETNRYIQNSIIDKNRFYKYKHIIKLKQETK